MTELRSPVLHSVCLSGILHIVDTTSELGLEPVSACALALVCEYISGSFPTSLFQEALLFGLISAAYRVTGKNRAK